jgi:ketosteroid isomerase-like protein
MSEENVEIVRRVYAEWERAWEHGTATAGEILDGGEHVIAENVWRGRGRPSGIEVEVHLRSVWTLSGGRATRVVQCDNRAQALEAVGMSEQAASFASRPARPSGA